MSDQERAQQFAEQRVWLPPDQVALLVEEFAAVRISERLAVASWLRAMGDQGDSARSRAPVFVALREAAERIERGQHEATP